MVLSNKRWVLNLLAGLLLPAYSLVSGLASAQSSSPGSLPATTGTPTPPAPATPSPVQPPASTSVPAPATLQQQNPPSVSTPNPVQPNAAPQVQQTTEQVQGAPATGTPTVAPSGQTAAPIQSPGTPVPSTQPSPQPSLATPSFTRGQRISKISIPKSSAVTVTFCSTVRFDSKQKSTFPAVVYLAQPLMDTNGNLLAPVNSLVNAQLKPTREGIQITIDALVVGGRFIPIQTAKLAVPMLAKTDQQNNSYSYSYNDNNLGIAFNVANGLQEWLNDQEILSDGFSDVLGAGLTVASGVSRARNRPKVTKVMEVPEGITLVFPLLASVSLPSMPLQALGAFLGQEAVCSSAKPGSQGSYYSPSSGSSSSYGNSPYNNRPD